MELKTEYLFPPAFVAMWFTANHIHLWLIKKREEKRQKEAQQ